MNFLKNTILCLTICFGQLLYSQSFTDLQQIQQAKLEAAVQRLTDLRNDIQQQQIPLARKLNELELLAKTLRADLAKARRIRDSRSVDLETLQKSVDAQRKEYDYIIHTLFSEYNSNYESNLSVGELSNYGVSVRKLNLLLDKSETTELEVLQGSLALLTESFRRIESTIGGKSYAGAALTANGLLVDGTFVQLGPLLYFSDHSGEHAGIVQESPSLNAQIRSIDTKSDSAIKAIASTGTGMLPMDLSLGNALALKEARSGVLKHLKKGGIWVYPIIAFALISALIALIKSIQIATIRQPEPGIVHEMVELLRDDRHAEALSLAKAQPWPARDMLVQAVTHSEGSIELIEESTYESMLSTQPKLEKHLNVIAVTATVAPLLGLLGTVTGIIKTFNLMQVFGAGDPTQLISGISEALITTELGLVLAIPALIIHAILSRKVAGIMAYIERLSVAFINSLSRYLKK